MFIKLQVILIHWYKKKKLCPEQTHVHTPYTWKKEHGWKMKASRILQDHLLHVKIQDSGPLIVWRVDFYLPSSLTKDNAQYVTRRNRNISALSESGLPLKVGFP